MESSFSEVRDVLSMISKFRRSPDQRNDPYTSDVETLKIREGVFLSTSMDALSEEFELGIVRNPRTMGWLAVTSSVSDLAACGLKPEALMMSYGIPPTASTEEIASVTRGIQEACNVYGTYVLGGIPIIRQRVGDSRDARFHFTKTP